MTDRAYTLTLDDAVSEALIAEATASETTPEQLASDLVRDTLAKRRDHHAWMMGEIEIALREADDPSVERISHEVVMEESRQQRETLLARAAAIAR